MKSDLIDRPGASSRGRASILMLFTVRSGVSVFLSLKDRSETVTDPEMSSIDENSRFAPAEAERI